MPPSSIAEPFLLDQVSQLVASGDWCIAGRVEAAFQSASALGDALQTIIEGSE